MDYFGFPVNSPDIENILCQISQKRDNRLLCCKCHPKYIYLCDIRKHWSVKQPIYEIFHLETKLNCTV